MAPYSTRAQCLILLVTTRVEFLCFDLCFVHLSPPFFCVKRKSIICKKKIDLFCVVTLSHLPLQTSPTQGVQEGTLGRHAAQRNLVKLFLRPLLDHLDLGHGDTTHHIGKHQRYHVKPKRLVLVLTYTIRAADTVTIPTIQFPPRKLLVHCADLGGHGWVGLVEVTLGPSQSSKQGSSGRGRFRLDGRAILAFQH